MEDDRRGRVPKGRQLQLTIEKQSHVEELGHCGESGAWRSQCRGIARRSGSQGVLGVLGQNAFLRFFAGVCPFFAGGLRQFVGVSCF